MSDPRDSFGAAFRHDAGDPIRNLTAAASHAWTAGLSALQLMTEQAGAAAAGAAPTAGTGSDPLSALTALTIDFAAAMSNFVARGAGQTAGLRFTKPSSPLPGDFAEWPDLSSPMAHALMVGLTSALRYDRKPRIGCSWTSCGPFFERSAKWPCGRRGGWKASSNGSERPSLTRRSGQRHRRRTDAAGRRRIKGRRIRDERRWHGRWGERGCHRRTRLRGRDGIPAPADHRLDPRMQRGDARRLGVAVSWELQIFPAVDDLLLLPSIAPRTDSRADDDIGDGGRTLPQRRAYYRRHRR